MGVCLTTTCAHVGGVYVVGNDLRSISIIFECPLSSCVNYYCYGNSVCSVVKLTPDSVLVGIGCCN